MTPDEFRSRRFSSDELRKIFPPRSGDPYAGLRRDNCSRVQRDLEIYAHEAGHESRERSFAEWMQAHPHVTWVVAGHLANIAERRA